ncbi:MAG TPA: DNA-processing protein DprA [Candidatus Binataceae bacterium]|nr:DNA-processing protein DprA [Candidatus Binataceae bacterium]
MAPTSDAYWLALRRVRGVGPRTAVLLLQRFQTAEAVFHASEQEILAAGIPRPTARNIREFSDFAPLERELCELPKIGARLIRWTDDEYPTNLRHIADPPPYLFVRGSSPGTNPKCVAVVGARAASDAGRRMAQRLGLELAANGFVVVSGLARGIDAEAHQAALDARGKTVAVMGCGVDVIYPPEHRRLAELIIESGGALVSELPMGTPPIAENFPGRNRMISGMALGVVIVEAAEKSGSLITARMALEQDRQVFAVPGSPLTGKTRGSNRLLKEGARLVECVEDVIEELLPQLGETGNTAPTQHPDSSNGSSRTTSTVDENASTETQSLLSVLKGTEKVHVDALIESSGMSPQTVLRLLLELELGGTVVQHPGKMFSLARP